MTQKGIIRKGEYYDSVSLMIVSQEINKLKGIIDSSVVMGTHENLAILKVAGLYSDAFSQVCDADLLISLKAESQEHAEKALAKIDVLFKELRSGSEEGAVFAPRSIENAIKVLPGANLAIISIAGKYAVEQAREALKNGLHTMIFSDNISVEDEIALKDIALENGLLLMGPDCGTAIINDVPLAFANVVKKGTVGIVAASGTGLQEVSSIISNLGAGISQAIGTGGRDVKKEVGGRMFLQAMKALAEDEQTKVIVLISKPPHPEVLDKIAKLIPACNKPVVSILIGGDAKTLKDAGAYTASTLEDAALKAVNLVLGEEHSINSSDSDFVVDYKQLIKKEVRHKTDPQKFIRGLYSGGTLCDETQLIFSEKVGFVYSNSPLSEDFRLEDLWKSKENTIIDMGEDEFTQGRPHPMIDYSLRNRRIIEESKDEEVAVILMDVVLGYGANLKPADELVPVIEDIKKSRPDLSVIVPVTGTDMDPQHKQKVLEKLRQAGALVMPSNASAAKLAAEIIAELQ